MDQNPEMNQNTKGDQKSKSKNPRKDWNLIIDQNPKNGPKSINGSNSKSKNGSNSEKQIKIQNCKLQK